MYLLPRFYFHSVATEEDVSKPGDTSAFFPFIVRNNKQTKTPKIIDKVCLSSPIS